jgi:hypothetical protein
VVVLIGAFGCSGAAPDRRADRAPSARWLCDSRARREVSQSVGTEVRITPPRHVRRMSCTYALPAGTIAVSISGHRTVAGAREELDAIARRRGRRPESPMFGEGLQAFMTTDGSVIVRHGRDVLDVDAARLPPQFGQPAQSAPVVARAVAGTIVSRWVPE